MLDFAYSIIGTHMNDKENLISKSTNKSTLKGRKLQGKITNPFSKGGDSLKF